MFIKGNGESWDDVYERAKSFFEDIKETYFGLSEKAPDALPHILVVSHAGFIKEFLSYALKKRCPFAVLNTSITTIFIDSAGNTNLLRKNEVPHLSDIMTVVSQQAAEHTPTNETHLENRMILCQPTLASVYAHHATVGEPIINLDAEISASSSHQLGDVSG